MSLICTRTSKTTPKNATETLHITSDLRTVLGRGGIAVVAANGVQCRPTLSDIGMQPDVIPQLLLFGLLDVLG